MSTQSSSKRILWMDIAKAIAIFAMIQGHTTPYGSTARNFIYSFHMPLFFLLTGFTAKNISTLGEFWMQLKKDFTRLVVPYVLVQTLNGVISFLMYHENAMDSIRLRVEQLIWGSAIDVYGHSCVGMIWFLIALFWAKTLYNLVQVIFPSQYNWSVFLFLAILAKVLSNAQIYLPQSIDVALMATLFICMGHYFKEYFGFYKQYQIPIVFIAFGIWMLCVENGTYIELGGRWYPNMIWGILGAICGCLCVCTFSQALESNKLLAKILGYFGRNTLTILYVSFLDWIALPFWGRTLNFAYVARPAVVLLVSIIVIQCKKYLNMLLQKLHSA